MIARARRPSGAGISALHFSTITPLLKLISRP